MRDEEAVYLRQAVQDDEPFVRQLEETCMRDYAIALWGNWEADAGEFAPELHRIIVSDGVDIGCVETAEQADHVYVDKLYLLPSHQRQGIVAVVLRRLIDEARGLAFLLRLSVLTTNPAQAFYLREGLRELGRDPERIGFQADYFP